MAPPSELLRAVVSARGGDFLRAADEGGLLAGWFPELERGRGFEQPELHAFTVLDHNLAAVGAFDAVLGESHRGNVFRAKTAWLDPAGLLEGDVEGVPLVALTRLACLLHDIAKPATATLVDGRLRFPRHGPRGAEIVEERLPELGFGPAATRLVASLVRYHLRPRELVRPWPPTDRAVRRFLHDLDGHMLPLLLVNLADGMATQGPHYTEAHFDRHCNFLNYVMSRVVALDERGGPQPLIGGQDLLTELGMEGGRLVGAVLTSVLAAQGAGEVRTREQALAYARTVLDELKQRDP